MLHPALGHSVPDQVPISFQPLSGCLVQLKHFTYGGNFTQIAAKTGTSAG